MRPLTHRCSFHPPFKILRINRPIHRTAKSPFVALHTSSEPARPNLLHDQPRIHPDTCRPRSYSSESPSPSPALPAIAAFQPTGLLRGKRAVITGSSRGIGKAIAERYAAEGATCVLVGRHEAPLLAVRESLQTLGDGHEEGSVQHLVRVGDVGSGEFWKGLRGLKPIDILVNAAGITHYSPLFATTEELLEKIVATNLVGTMLGCKVIGKTMMGNAGGGCIINVASLLGLKGGKGSAGYVASKAGVIGFTRALAAEVGRSNIRVNVIVPGYIETDMTAAMTPEAHSAALNAIPLKRFGEPSEIADAAVFLASNEYANNCVLNLDGGLSAM